MRKLFLPIAFISCTTHLHAASDNSEQSKIDATHILATAWNTFSTSWKKTESALASKRAEVFSSTTGLEALVIYADTGSSSVNKTLPGSRYRLGLTGLKLGKHDIECFVSHPDDRIEELTKVTTHMGWGPCTLNEKRPIYPTIWHFLESEKGKELIEEYIALSQSK